MRLEEERFDVEVTTLALGYTMMSAPFPGEGMDGILFRIRQGAESKIRQMLSRKKMPKGFLRTSEREGLS